MLRRLLVVVATIVLAWAPIMCSVMPRKMLLTILCLRSRAWSFGAHSTRSCARRQWQSVGQIASRLDRNHLVSTMYPPGMPMPDILPSNVKISTCKILKVVISCIVADVRAPVGAHPSLTMKSANLSGVNGYQRLWQMVHCNASLIHWSSARIGTSFRMLVIRLKRVPRSGKWSSSCLKPFQPPNGPLYTQQDCIFVL